ncbi:MAG: hypothetical protein V1644_01720 [Candidatus Micrarchaeota archaeon]
MKLAKSKLKGQIAMEFITVFFLIFVIFVFIQTRTFTITSSLSQQSTVVQAVKLLDESETLISLTSHSTALSSQFYLPPFLQDGSNYIFKVSNSSVSITWNSTTGLRSLVRSLYAYNIINSTGASNFDLGSGNHFIKKFDGGVMIS